MHTIRARSYELELHRHVRVMVQRRTDPDLPRLSAAAGKCTHTLVKLTPAA